MSWFELYRREEFVFTRCTKRVLQLEKCLKHINLRTGHDALWVSVSGSWLDVAEQLNKSLEKESLIKSPCEEDSKCTVTKTELYMRGVSSVMDILLI